SRGRALRRPRRRAHAGVGATARGRARPGRERRARDEPAAAPGGVARLAARADRGARAGDARRPARRGRGLHGPRTGRRRGSGRDRRGRGRSRRGPGRRRRGAGRGRPGGGAVAGRPRALVSVSDKTGVEELARGLVALGYEVVSTGNTLRARARAGVPATAVADVTGFPEVLGGRVKSLHPAIHGGVLALRTPEHLAELEAHGITPVDVVVCNLYPFGATVAREGVTDAEAMEQVDIGGPAMIRAAAKNHAHVTVVVDPADYAPVLAELRAGITAARRRELALKAFAHTAAYDAAIVAYLQRGQALPRYLGLPLERAQELRYGENPHQAGARYRLVGAASVWDDAVLHSGQALSYLNVFDAEAAWRLAHELPGVACVIVKHANARGGAAVAEDLVTAYERAFDADPKSAFGGVVALPGRVTLALAERIAARPKADVVLAHAYEPEALELLAAKRKSTRVISLAAPGES